MLYEDDNFSLYATGKYEIKSMKDGEEWYLKIEVVFENKTAEIAHVYSNTCVVDGWTVEIGQLDDTEPFTKLKDILYITLPSSDFPDPEAISNISIDLYVKLKESKQKDQLGKMYLSLEDLSNQE